MTLFDPPGPGAGGGARRRPPGVPGGHGPRDPAPGDAPPAADVPAGPVCRLLLAYDGTDFHGFAAQPGMRTVAGVLGDALARHLRGPAALTVAGRTDAGVHAWGQVVSFVAPPGTEPERLARAVNSMLAPEVVVRAAALAPPGFDARRSARWRRYRFTVLNRPVPDPFRARFEWWVPDPIDVRALYLAADPFVGEHDFAAFCRKGPEGTTTTRRVLDSAWRDLGDGRLRYEVRASAFCWQMVRSMVGTMVEAGRGRRRPGDVMAALRSRDRSVAGPVAPPNGLCLWEVGY
ncbi:MAG: tRNA pseudouridine(38-40) synthase TruA [Acidimicrobiia bacterium]|nr:tRNA pseudouridine(38-40) synthase TruA [Acidimicrobiia bacterium]